MKSLRNLFLASLVACAAFLAPPAHALDLSLDGNLRGNCGTATATAGAATLANKCGKVTSEALSTAAAAVYTLTITDTVVAATDVCFASVANGTSSTGVPAVSRVQAASTSLVVTVQNIAAAAAFNGTLVVNFFCFKA